MLHRNDRSDEGSSEKDEDSYLDNGLKKEWRVISTHELGQDTESTANRQCVLQCNARGKLDAGETVYSVCL